MLLRDGRTCTENIRDFLLFSRKTDIRRISFDTDDHTDVVIPLEVTSKDQFSIQKCLFHCTFNLGDSS